MAASFVLAGTCGKIAMQRCLEMEQNQQGYWYRVIQETQLWSTDC